MILTHDVADDAGRFAVRTVPVVIALVHHMQDAAMNGFEAVPDVRQRAAHDHAHRVIEIRLAHFVFYRNMFDIIFERRRRDGFFGQKIRSFRVSSATRRRDFSIPSILPVYSDSDKKPASP
jgi:hypothetical protein